jgi:hypothetical protein
MGFGAFVIGAMEFDRVFRFAERLLGREKALDFEKAASFETMFYVVFAFLFFSFAAVLLDRWRRK